MSIEPNYNVDHLDVNKTVDEDSGDTTVELYNAAHGKTKRTGGPYLDDIEREKAEEFRAKMEDREPDYENAPAVAGTLLVPKSQLVERDVDKSHMFDSIEVENEPVDSYVVPAEKNEPDPTQADWDNDGTKVAALQNAQLYKDLVEAHANTPEGENV